MKRTDSPWILSADQKHLADLNQKEVAIFLKTEDAKYAVEACNGYNYQKEKVKTLQAENAKLQESNNAMAEYLKSIYKNKIQMHNATHDFTYKADASIVETVLTAAGHKV